MPSTGTRAEDRLIDLFLTVYDGRSWSDDKTVRVRPERMLDGGVEMIATRNSDGCRLAIEHTLVEAFVGEKGDFHKHFKELQRQLTADQSLYLAGVAIYVNFPPNVLPRGSDWQRIINDIRNWIRENAHSFSDRLSEHRCPLSSHPTGELTVQARAVGLNDSSKQFLIIQRFGEIKVGESVEKALRTKLPKLARTDSDRRLLMLERDQPWVDVDSIYSEIVRRRDAFVDLRAIDEIWIADTASFGEAGRYVCFDRRDGQRRAESFTFYDGILIERVQDGIAVSVNE